MANNYKDIIVNQNSLRSLPDNGIPNELLSVETEDFDDSQPTDPDIGALRWLPRVFTNNPSYQAYVTEGNLVTLSLRFCSRDSPLRLPI